VTNVPLRLDVSALAELKPLAHRLAVLPACLEPGTTGCQCSAYNVPYFVSSGSDSSDHSPGKEGFDCDSTRPTCRCGYGACFFGFLVVFALSITAVPTEANSQAAAAATDPPSTQVCFQRALSTFVELLHDCTSTATCLNSRHPLASRESPWRPLFPGQLVTGKGNASAIDSSDERILLKPSPPPRPTAIANSSSSTAAPIDLAIHTPPQPTDTQIATPTEHRRRFQQRRPRSSRRSSPPCPSSPDR
jgi:hypothetical protein